jgi:hypothetical protein
MDQSDSPTAGASRKHERSSEDPGDDSDGEEKNCLEAQKWPENSSDDATSSSPAVATKALKAKPLRSMPPLPPKKL